MLRIATSTRCYIAISPTTPPQPPTPYVHPSFLCVSLYFPTPSQVIKKLGGSTWPQLKVEFDRWRNHGQSIFPKEVWAAADEYHGYQWWQSFGDDFKYLSTLAMRVLSKPISASACEFNWSDVSQVISKKTSRRSEAVVDRMVNIRAMNKLEQSVERKLILGHMPKLDDFLNDLVQEAIDSVEGGGDDVGEAVELEEDSSDDEQYDVVCDDSDPLYELGGVCVET